MSVPVIEDESTLTGRYQTTVPASVRKTLRLSKRDKIRYTIRPDGEVTLSRVDDLEDDPALGRFLDFLAQDIGQNPQHVHAIGADLKERIQTLVPGVDIDLDSPLSDEDE